MIMLYVALGCLDYQASTCQQYLFYILLLEYSAQSSICFIVIPFAVERSCFVACVSTPDIASFELMSASLPTVVAMF